MTAVVKIVSEKEEEMKHLSNDSSQGLLSDASDSNEESDFEINLVNMPKQRT